MKIYDSAPSPLCARLAPLLPLLDVTDSDGAAIAEARGHLAICAHCQGEHQRYLRIDSALRQRFAVSTIARRPTEEIMRYIEHQAKGTKSPAVPGSGTNADHAGPARHLRDPRSIRRSRLSGLVAVTSVAALIALAVMLFAARASREYGGPPRYSFPGTTGLIASVSMVSPTEGWALAQVTKTAQGTVPMDEVTFYHYQRGTWTPVTVRTAENFAVGGVSGFNGTISMDSPTDGWAVAHNFNQVSALLHYSQGTWTEVRAPYLGTIQAVGSRSVWGIEFDQYNQPVFAHFDGARWVPQTITLTAPQGGADASGATGGSGNAAVGATAPSPTPAVTLGPTAAPGTVPATPTAEPIPPQNSPVTGVVAQVLDFQMASDTSGYALVSTGNSQYAIARYVDGKWNLTTSRFGAGDTVTFTRFAMVSASEAWVLGEKVVPDAHGITAHVPLQQLAYHYINGKWTSATIPVNAGAYTTLTQITMLSPTDGWIVGTEQSAYPGATTSDFQAHPVLFHFTRGQWQSVVVPQMGTPVAEVTQMVFGADGTGWAVGFVSNIPANQVVQDTDILAHASPLLWRYDGKGWSVAQP